MWTFIINDTDTSMMNYIDDIFKSRYRKEKHYIDQDA